jgi:molybdopterin-containing oxidoreductase family iron-sulfur binding subunit
MVACKVENNTPQGIFWMHTFRFEEGTFPNTNVWFLPRPCMHCDAPPCAEACPTDARFKREDGIVATNAETCIGCRYCQAACPYGVNYFNWDDPNKKYYIDWSDTDLAEATGGLVPGYDNPSLDLPFGDEQLAIAGGGKDRGVAEKCTFCVQRVENGMDPACVGVCPTSALLFGDLDDPDSDVSKMLADRQSFRLQEQFGTGPGVYYIGSHQPNPNIREVELVGGGV